MLKDILMILCSYVLGVLNSCNSIVSLIRILYLLELSDIPSVGGLRVISFRCVFRRVFLVNLWHLLRARLEEMDFLADLGMMTFQMEVLFKNCIFIVNA